MNEFDAPLEKHESHPIVTTNNIYRADNNYESPPRIPDVQIPGREVFAPEQNKLFAQHVFQDAQGLEGEVLYYHILGLNDSATEDDLKILSLNGSSIPP